MKIIYVGNEDCLSVALLERLNKEDNTIFVLGEKVKNRRFKKYHHFVWTKKSDDMKRVFASVSPDVVIFGGTDCLKAECTEKQRENLGRLSIVLEECAGLEKCQFILLSSVDVYGTNVENIEEEQVMCPETSKGFLMLQEEKILESYNGNKGLRKIILRLSQVYSNEIGIGSNDWLGELAANLVNISDYSVEDKMLQPVHVSDVADAVVRVLNGENDCVYNICGSKKIAQSEIIKLMAEELCPDKAINIIENNTTFPYISNNKIKKEKEWVEFWELEKMVSEKLFAYSHNREGDISKLNKKSILKGGVRKTIENIVVYAFFCMLFFLTKDHSLFAQVDWLLIYVVVISLSYGVKQSTLSVVLASGTYLIAQGTNILEMTNFYSYAESVLMIVEFLFFGIVVGYSADTLREEVRNCRNELSQALVSYDKLKEINDKTVLLKNEYEKRVLDAKTSLPKLYSIINRITVLDINRIFMEILHVVEELMHTETVAVYRVSSTSSYLRLIASLNKESVMEGNSWDLKNFPDIESAIRQNKLFEGDIWKNEPAMVLPVESSKGCEAAIVIKKLPMEAHSLHTVNMLRTLLTLISDSIEKALQYDNIVREQKYHKDTNILFPEEFRKAVALADEKKQREMAESCIISVKIKEDMINTYHSVEKMFREMDIWGSDEEGNLFVLLGNTSAQDAKVILERLEKRGIVAEKLEKI